MGDEQKEQRYAIIGDPVEHSLSPLIYEILFRMNGIEVNYEKIQVTRDTLDEFIHSIPKRGLSGFNVTMPLKGEIMRYLETIDFTVDNGVNTVRVGDGGALHGYSTDAEGFRLSLARLRIPFRGTRFVILGCGGAATALIESILREQPESLTIVNRTPEHAAAYASLTNVQVVQNIAEARDAIAKCDVLINATPLGMHGYPDTFQNYDFLDVLPKGAVVADLIYAPPQTKLLKEAAARGHATMNGVTMLAAQGIAAFQLFTGIPVHHDVLPQLAEALRVEVESTL